MAPLITLILFTGLGRLVGLALWPALDSWSVSAAIGLAAMFLLTAGSHFSKARRAGLVATVPLRLPRPDVIVSVTGVLELLGAIGLLVPVTRTAAAICLGLLLLAMFPANVYAAGEKRSPTSPNTPLVPRTIYQLVFLAACVVVILGV
ncbi:MAG: hypothetical protein JWN36_3118 [Microbacteriaceae bacterium]|nr:hypothetical protein [Microbacteriaceae bacterium]